MNPIGHTTAGVSIFLISKQIVGLNEKKQLWKVKKELMKDINYIKKSNQNKIIKFYHEINRQTV